MKLTITGLIALAATELPLVKGQCLDKTIAVGDGCQVPEVDVPSASDLYDATYFFNITSLEFATELPDPLTPGDHIYELNYTFDDFSNGTCIGTVTVVDDEPLNFDKFDCGTDGIMYPCDGPETFIATYQKENGCALESVMVTSSACQFCNGKGKTIDKSDSCEVEYEIRLQSIVLAEFKPSLAMIM